MGDVGQHARQEQFVHRRSGRTLQDQRKAFIKALRDAGAEVDVSATKRSDKRAYLFHWCWRIGLGKVKASAATAKPGVDIEWDHGNEE